MHFCNPTSRTTKSTYCTWFNGKICYSDSLEMPIMVVSKLTRSRHTAYPISPNVFPSILLTVYDTFTLVATKRMFIKIQDENEKGREWEWKEGGRENSKGVMIEWRNMFTFRQHLHKTPHAYLYGNGCFFECIKYISVNWILRIIFKTKFKMFLNKQPAPV